MFTVFAICSANYFDIPNWVVIITAIQDIALVGYMVKPTQSIAKGAV